MSPVDFAALETPLTYAAIFLMAILTAMGLPGPGEGLLVAGAIGAAEGRFSLQLVLLLAFAGGVAGCQIGYWLGRRYGREFLEGPGPLREFRIRTLQRGEALFAKYGAIASFVVPSPICGVKRVPQGTFWLFSSLSRLWWALSTGLLAYFIGEGLTELIRRSTHLPLILIVSAIAVAAGIGAWLLFRRRNRSTVQSPVESG